jgi:peptidoglycan hydrolase-like protein with peptidoglycan-binding domain
MTTRSRRAVATAVVLAAIASSAIQPAASAAARRPLRLGDRGLRVGAHGRDVRQLQRLLKQVGIDVQVDGQYGPGTADAVRRFQRAAHLLVSGVAGPRTARALLRAAQGGAAQIAGGGLAAQSTPPSTHDLGDRMPLRTGMSGRDVRVLQDLLNRAGFATRVDGQFGKGTAAAVKAFEAAAARPADAIVDATDLAALRQLAGAGPQRPGEVNAPVPLPPADTAQVGPDGLAVAPAAAPDVVKAIIAAGNQIAHQPYRYGGGHARWDDTAYDCSGSVSYALHQAGLIDQPMASGDFVGWGDPGVGQWVTIYANRGHMYMVVAGLRFDTSGAQQDGSRWHTTMRTSSGYSVRHVPGL